MPATKTKAKTKTNTKIKAKKNRVVAQITPETLLKDGGLFDAVALLCVIFNRKPRRPCVRQATIFAIRNIATMLLAQDKDVPDLMQLLDQDALQEGTGRSTTSEFVQTFEGKKVGRRR
jgi:hypothetical protein